MNAKYLADIRNDPMKEAEYLYSKFSPFQECIKTNEKFLLKDILGLVQTNLLKLYIEAGLKDKVYEFFNTGSDEAKNKDANLTTLDSQ